jgi:hypothetical protein
MSSAAQTPPSVSWGTQTAERLEGYLLNYLLCREPHRPPPANSSCWGCLDSRSWNRPHSCSRMTIVTVPWCEPCKTRRDATYILCPIFGTTVRYTSYCTASEKMNHAARPETAWRQCISPSIHPKRETTNSKALFLLLRPRKMKESFHQDCRC